MKSVRLLFIIITAITAFPEVSVAQFQFGQNKVQYNYYNWKYIQSEHFDLYFTEGNYRLAEYAIASAESAYVKINRDFKYSIKNRISFIIYGSHNEFQQTNAISEYLSEGIGGVTELFKNRIVLPFEGNYDQFRHVIHHELVHAVINDMFYGGSIQNIISNNIQVDIPLWFNEGVAEFSALDWDSNTDLFMRDAVINNYLAPIQGLNGYFAYRGGQSLWYYITQKYGREKIAEIMAKLQSTKSSEQAFLLALGLNYEELTERWQKDLKVRYWPEIATRDDIKNIGRQLTNHQKDGSNYNTSPSISPRGDKIAIITDKNGYIDIYLLNAIDGKVIKKLVDGQRSRNFEELHLITPGITWSPDGKKIAVATKAGGEDAIILLDIETGDEESLVFGLDGIFSVDWSRDGEKIAFQGLKNGYSDIYVYDLKSKSLTNLTSDPFSDSEPAWSSDSKKIVFVSDRQDYKAIEIEAGIRKMIAHNLSNSDIFEIQVESKSVKRLTTTDLYDETNPIYSPDGNQIIYISDENGSYNIYAKDLTTEKSRPLTNVLQGIRQMSLTYDGNKLALVALDNGGFDIFTINNPFDLKVKGDSLTPNTWAQFRAGQAMKKQKPGLTKKTTDSSDEVVDTLKNFVFDPNNLGEPIKSEKDDLNFRDYKFSEKAADEVSQDQPVNVMEYSSERTRTPEGGFKVFDYKLNFSADVAYGNAEVNTLYGVSGLTQMMFSDMLGNHQIFFATNLMLDLKNSMYYLSYQYLARRYDIGVFGYHTSRFFGLEKPFLPGYYEVYRFRNYGIGLSFRYPFDKFNRIGIDLGLSTLTKENLDDPSQAIEDVSFVNPRIEYIHDTVLWGPIAPNNGSRYGVSFYTVPKYFSDRLEFYSFSVDYRKYFRFTDYTTIALRGTGSISNGKTPQKYFIGGVENWLNVRLDNPANFPIQQIEDFVFAEGGLPLRGYNLNTQYGSRYFITNAEFRFPMLFWLLPEANTGTFFMGTIFTDMGAAWDRTHKFQAFSDENGVWGTQDLLMGSGFGIRTFLAYFLIRIDVAWSYNFRRSSHPQYYFSLGGDF